MKRSTDVITNSFRVVFVWYYSKKSFAGTPGFLWLVFGYLGNIDTKLNSHFKCHFNDNIIRNRENMFYMG